MALYDNKFWLLSHIRNSFISTDDTGMCELVMVGESKDIKQHLKNMESYPEPEDSEDEDDDFESYDLQADMDFGIRERTNTAAQLEKLDQARKKASKMTHIKWETNENTQNVNDMFVKKDACRIVKSGNQKSLLTTLINNYSNVPKNPYIDYAKFDGNGLVNIPTKKFKIFLIWLPPPQRNYPLNICCVASARIEDLIGLILLKYSSTHGVSSLNPVTQYGLYITEEDGEVDRDFPCLEVNEPISKFGFNYLGLMEHKDGVKSVRFPEESSHLFPIEDMNKIRITEEKAKAEETRQMENDIQAVEDHNKMMEAPLYRSFKVFLVTKVRHRVEVNVGVSGERIEIDPIPQKSSKLIPFKQRAVSHSIDTIVSCEVTDVKSNKTSFRLVYRVTNIRSPTGQGDVAFFSSASSYPPSMQSSASFKHYDFEGDNATALDIVQKIKLILELRSSVSRGDYFAAREKKLNKKKSFNLGK